MWGWGGGNKPVRESGKRKTKQKKVFKSIQHPTKEKLSLESNKNLPAVLVRVTIAAMKYMIKGKVGELGRKVHWACISTPIIHL